MSVDIAGGIEYARLIRHYDCDEYVSLAFGGVVILNGIPFTATEDYHIVGLIAYLNDSTVVSPLKGWTLFAHGQSVAPIYLAGILAALGLPWPTSVPAFEAKDILFWADQNCWVRFEGSNRARHYIPANTFMRFHRRCFMFWVQRDTVSGTLRTWIEG